eukprot:3871855-Amphidinium_carterae.1
MERPQLKSISAARGRSLRSRQRGYIVCRKHSMIGRATHGHGGYGVVLSPFSVRVYLCSIVQLLKAVGAVTSAEPTFKESA